MISDLLLSLLACALLLSGGIGLVLLTRAIDLWRPAALFGLSWNLGLLSLYLCGNVFIWSGSFPGNWTWWVGGVCLGIGLLALGRSKTRPKWEVNEEPRLRRPAQILVAVCLAFLLFKAVLVFGVLMRMPVIDSDAANLNRWVGLAKDLAFRGSLAETASQSYERFSPSLVPAYIAGYLSRWRDNLVSIPWFFTWISIPALAWGTVKSFTRSSLWAAGVALLFASVPLSLVHVMRPGFSDLLLAGFMMSAVYVFLLTMYRQNDYTLRSWILLSLSLLGAVLTKKEGIIWAIWLIGIALCFSLHHRRKMRWSRIALALVFAGGVSALSYAVLQNWIRTSLITDERIKWLFEFNYSDRATWMFFKTLFASNGFGLLYWIMVGLSAGLLVRLRDAAGRALLILGLLPFIFLFYFCCFTGNTAVTERGTNIGRLLLPLQAFALPVFLVAWESWRRNWPPGEEAGLNRRSHSYAKQSLRLAKAKRK